MVDSYKSLLRNMSPFFPKGKTETTLKEFLEKGDGFNKILNRTRKDTVQLLNELIEQGWMAKKNGKVMLLKHKMEKYSVTHMGPVVKRVDALVKRGVGLTPWPSIRTEAYALENRHAKERNDMRLGHMPKQKQAQILARQRREVNKFIARIIRKI